MLPLRFFAAIFTCTALLPIHAMEQQPLLPELKQPLSHSLYMQQETHIINSRREMLEKYDGKIAPSIHPDIKFVAYAQNDELTKRCDYFALKKATGFTKHQDFYNSIDLIQSFFHQTKKPQPGDIVLYTISDKDLRVTHVAVVQAVIKSKTKLFGTKKPQQTLLFQSKWGENPEIFEHPPFAVPGCYGKACAFFRLNNERNKK